MRRTYIWLTTFIMVMASCYASGSGVEVLVMTVKSNPVTFTKELPGRTTAFRVAEIRPQVGGIIVKRLFEEGSEVQEGQALYQIDPAPYKAAYEQAKAALLKAEANIKSLKAKAERYQEVVKANAISRQELDDSEADFAQGEADIALAKAALESARINLDYTTVYSPISGRIGQSFVTEGALVTANQDSVLAVVQQFDQIYVDVLQPVKEFMALREQNEARIRAGGSVPTAQLLIDHQEYGQAGQIQFADARVHENTGMVQIRTIFPNPGGRIFPGLFVHVRLVQYADEEAILVPQKAVIRQPDGGVKVWVVNEENKVFPQSIKVKEIVGDQWRVVGGLKTGEKIVLEGVLKIAPGAVVTPVETNRG